MFSRVVTVGLVVGMARVASAQDRALLIPHDREASARVAKIVASAEAAGLPTDAIVSKVGYGVSVTRANPDRIVAAASIVAARLETARTALAPNPAPHDITAGANALGEGATPDALRTIRRASGNRPVVVPLGLLAQMLTKRMPLDRATKLVTDLVRRGATPEQLVALGGDVEADVASGTNALAAIDARTRGLIAVLAAPGGSAVGDFNAAIGGPRNDPGNPPKPPRP